MSTNSLQSDQQLIFSNVARFCGKTVAIVRYVYLQLYSYWTIEGIVFERNCVLHRWESETLK